MPRIVKSGLVQTRFELDGSATLEQIYETQTNKAAAFAEGKKEDKVTLAKSGSDGFASRAGEPGAAKIDASAIDAVTKALQELK